MQVVANNLQDKIKRRYRQAQISFAGQYINSNRSYERSADTP
jgi:hypothetical protein